MLLTAVCLVTTGLVYWAFLHFVLAKLAHILPNEIEIPCTNRRVPARIAVVGPPTVDATLARLDACGSVVSEIALASRITSPIECAWRALETYPDLVVVRDAAKDALHFAHLVRKAGFIGVVLLNTPTTPHAERAEVADANADVLDGVSSDAYSALALYDWVASRHMLLPREFLLNYTKTVQKIGWHTERGNAFSARRLAHRAVWKSSMRGEMRLYSTAKRLADELSQGKAAGGRIRALERVTAQAYALRDGE